jgi:hypothetical protein
MGAYGGRGIGRSFVVILQYDIVNVKRKDGRKGLD